MHDLWHLHPKNRDIGKILLDLLLYIHFNNLLLLVINTKN